MGKKKRHRTRSGATNLQSSKQLKINEWLTAKELVSNLSGLSASNIWNFANRFENLQQKHLSNM